MGSIFGDLLGLGSATAATPAQPAASSNPDAASVLAQLMAEEKANRPYDMLLKLGLGLMSSRSPSLAGAIGEAGAKALMSQDDSESRVMKRFMLQQQVGDATQKQTDRQTLRKALASDPKLTDTQRSLYMSNPDLAKEYLKRSMGSGLMLMDGTPIGGQMTVTPSPGGQTMTIPKSGPQSDIPMSSLARGIIGAESGGNVNATNPNSSATGPGQFIDQTWLDLMSRHAPGLAQGKDRDEVLGMRSDPEVSAKMVDAYGSDNRSVLSKALGRDPTDAELYIAHFAGPQGAVRLLGADPMAPSTSAATPEAAAANRSLFYNGDQTRTVGELRDMLTRRFNRFAAPAAAAPGGVQVAQAAGATMTDASPERLVGQGVRTESRLHPVQDADGKIVAGWGYNSQTRQIEPMDEGRPTNDQKDYEYARRQGYGGTFQEFMKEMKAAGKTEISLPANISVGNIPPGFQLQRDGDSIKMVPIPGGPAAADAADKEKAAGKQKMQGERAGALVSQEVGRVLNLMDTAMLPTTGGIGNTLSRMPGTAAHDISKLLDTIRAEAAFGRLQQMRESSPTGGALGGVSEKEMALLTSAIGSLEQSQSKDQFSDNLKRVNNIYMDIVHGSGNGPSRYSLSFEGKMPTSGKPAAPRVLRFDAQGNMIQ